MNRFSIAFTLIASCCVSLAVYTDSFADDSRLNLEEMPHSQALQLVLSTQEKRIRAIEEAFSKSKPKGKNSGDEPWWFDTISRTWKVVRPFAPGVFDSRPNLTVTYYIGDELVGRWWVDLASETATFQVNQN